MTDTIDFYGDATPLKDTDFARAAQELDCEEAAIRAVAQVESGGLGGFLPDKRPRILFESHYFSRLTGGRYDASHPDISTPKWVRNYKGGAAEYSRLHEAMALDADAALESASWGMFQIMGANHRAVGFDTVDAYVTAMVPGEAPQLQAFCAFLKSQTLDTPLRNRDWAAFARGYNGPGFAKNAYDTRLAEAYDRLTKGDHPRPSVSTVQTALNAHGADPALTVDGLMGPATRRAIRAFQTQAGLGADGIAGPKTLAALGVA